MKKLTLRTEFFCWVLLGLLVFGILSFGAYPAMCLTSQSYERQENRDPQASANQDGAADHVKQGVTLGQQRQDNAKDGEQPANDENQHGIKHSVFCNELRLTDVALVFFTYCLVIVGWFQIRTGEHTLYVLERALMFCGAGLPISLGPTGTTTSFWVGNYGKTPGILREIYFETGVNPPTGDKAVYSGAGITHKLDSAIQPGFNGPFGNIHIPLISPTSTTYIWGYIKYLDIFKHTHTNKFCMKVTPPMGFETAGKPDWNEFD